MNATENALKVGDYVIYVKKYGDRPVKTTISKVTPKGWLRINAEGGASNCSFRPTYNTNKFETSGGGYIVYPFSEEKFAELNAKAEECENNLRERREAEAERKAALEARDAAEMDATKAAMNNNVWMHVTSKQTLPDGSRLYMMNVPVKDEYKERKQNFEVAIVRCKEVKDLWEKDSPAKVETHLTFCNGSNTSFASRSGEHFTTDEEALWANACYLLNRW